jgi:hypothetical protein
VFFTDPMLALGNAAHLVEQRTEACRNLCKGANIRLCVYVSAPFCVYVCILRCVYISASLCVIVCVRVCVFVFLF